MEEKDPLSAEGAEGSSRGRQPGDQILFNTKPAKQATELRATTVNLFPLSPLRGLCIQV